MDNLREKALALIGIVAGVVFAVGLGLYTFFSNAATPLHPNAQDVPSMSDTAPADNWTETVEQARQIARSGLIEQNLPGLSIAVGVAGEIVWTEGFGWADLEKRVPMAPGTRIRVGHTSKALTSAAVGLLLEKRRLHLDDEIQTYVPAFPRKQWPITLRQVMGHLAGIRHYENERDFMPAMHCERAAEGLPLFADDPLRFAPETRYGYSTFGWILASAAVEAVAGEPFFTFMQTQVFRPLGMADTEPDAGTEPIPNRATFYYPRLSGDPGFGAEPATPVDYSCFAGGGGFLSTPSDLVRFAMALDNGTLLKPDTVRMLQTPQLLASGEETAYGLGWMLETVSLAGEPARLASHASRTLLGGSVSFMTFPERGIVVAVLTNISRASTRSMALRIAEIFAVKARG